MSEEDFVADKHVEVVVGMDLSMLSISELEKRITILKHEISRIRSDIATKEVSKAAAESVFRS